MNIIMVHVHHYQQIQFDIQYQQIKILNQHDVDI